MTEKSWDRSDSICFRKVSLQQDDAHRYFNTGWNALLVLILREHPEMAAQWGGLEPLALEAAA